MEKVKEVTLDYQSTAAQWYGHLWVLDHGDTNTALAFRSSKKGEGIKKTRGRNAELRRDVSEFGIRPVMGEDVRRRNISIKRGNKIPTPSSSNNNNNNNYQSSSSHEFVQHPAPSESKDGTIRARNTNTVTTSSKRLERRTTRRRPTLSPEEVEERRRRRGERKRFERKRDRKQQQQHEEYYQEEEDGGDGTRPLYKT